ncbi:unnamed protein product, partial [Ectocarpus sp. 13 AM-2016]
CAEILPALYRASGTIQPALKGSLDCIGEGSPIGRGNLTVTRTVPLGLRSGMTAVADASLVNAIGTDISSSSRGTSSGESSRAARYARKVWRGQIAVHTNRKSYAYR